MNIYSQSKCQTSSPVVRAITAASTTKPIPKPIFFFLCPLFFSSFVKSEAGRNWMEVSPSSSWHREWSDVVCLIVQCLWQWLCNAFREPKPHLQPIWRNQLQKHILNMNIYQIQEIRLIVFYFSRFWTVHVRSCLLLVLPHPFLRNKHSSNMSKKSNPCVTEPRII